MLARAPAVIAFMLAAATAAAQDAGGYPARSLLSTGQTILGETLQYPTSGPAHVTAAIVFLAPGQRTVVHKHGVPLLGYILEGVLTVDYGPRGSRMYRAGEAFMEAMDVAHFGINNGKEPVRLLAVYMGAKGSEDVILAK